MLVVAAERARVAAVLRAEGVAEVLISRRVAGGRLVAREQLGRPAQRDGVLRPEERTEERVGVDRRRAQGHDARRHGVERLAADDGDGAGRAEGQVQERRFAREAEVRALEGEGARAAGAARQVVGDARQAQGHRLHPRREAHRGPRLGPARRERAVLINTELERVLDERGERPEVVPRPASATPS